MMDTTDETLPETSSPSAFKSSEVKDLQSAHKPLRFCQSIGEDSAIGMQLPDEALLNNADTVSENSFRSVSQTDDRILLNAEPADSVSMAPTEQPTFSKDMNPNRHVPLGRQRSTDTSKFFSVTPSSCPPSRQNSVVQESAFETYNPMFSRAPPSVVNHGPHVIHHANTFPALHPINEVQSMAGPQYQMRNFQYASQPQAVLHASNGQLVPLRGPGYGAMCNMGNNGASLYGSPYYTVQSPPSISDMSRMSSQACFSPEQPYDVRVSFPFPKPPVQKTESLVTSNASMYYTEDIAALRPLHTRPSHGSSSSDEEVSKKMKNRLFRHVITKTLSSVYAIFVIVLGAILYVNDVLGTVGHSYVEVFQIYLFMIAITFYIFIHIDIRRHLQTQRLDELACEEENAALADVTRDFHARGPSKTTPLNLRYGNDPTLRDARFEELEEPSVYRFNTGRHAGSLYLKLGAVG
ncbi:hypothetical protein RvY_17834-2 [Ramazzottius varieornatus]|uniref:Uncharacterized protein n=1 Tax=Ramazzottius varieornatus TaxID=947166 RepID=A0A1D1W3L6_RAMVA|nr:hypothetical protein RvY_17834-2 [Ramazzottius varieornatus]